MTVTEGTNVLVGTDPGRITAAAEDVLNEGGKKGGTPALWDGRASERIISILREKP